MKSRFKILGMKVDKTTCHDLIEKSVERSMSKDLPGSFICVSNVHMCIEALDHKDFQKKINSSLFTIADGKPIHLLLSKHLKKNNEFAPRLRGEDVFRWVLKNHKTIKDQFKIGFYGGQQDALDLIKDKIKKDSSINACYFFSPPFRELSDNELHTIYDEINKLNLDLLFVGLGCPKQENWMYESSKHISVTQIGVGAVFDFYSGTKKTCPPFISNIGFEWLFRLCSEPRRLLTRYLYTNSKFLMHIFISVFKKDKL